MRILLEENAISEACYQCWVGRNKSECDAVAKSTAKKILIELQAIYNLPDEGMFHNKMGEFIEGLNEEVSDNK